jgi:butyryl-CoA dehydrogenase
MLLDSNQRQLRDSVRKFARERLLPGAADRDRASRFPADQVAEMAAMGLFGTTLPGEWGGAGTGALAFALVMEEVGYADASCGAILSAHVLCATAVLKSGSGLQKERYLRALATGKMLAAFALTEPQGGSDNASMATRARKAGSGYVISGAKQFITSGATAELALVFAVTNAEAQKNRISAFLVPTSSKGWVVSRKEDKLGLRASDTCQIVLEGLEVGEDHRLGAEGEGLRVAFGNLEGGRIAIAALAVGIAQAAFDAALAYAKERHSFGKAIVEHQAVAFRLAAMASRIEAARQLVHHAAVLRDVGEPCLKEACMAKLTASDMAEQVCSDAIQTLGGYGYVSDFPVERLYRDARVTRIFEGTNDIQQLVIARELMKS